ncbi:MAG TPA: hypothetical protein VLM76_09355 [Patescibacteria group bacterium]|nr:hypothetical protein [Patescibacteria group bacterium]
MASFYGTAQGVRDRTGVRAADLGQPSEAALTTFLEGILAEASDLMDRRIGTSFLATTAPVGLTGIALDIAADAIRIMIATRQTPIVRIDDFAVATIRSQMLSPDVIRRLRLYGRQGMTTVWLTTED